MRHAVTGFWLAICLAMLSAAPAFTQTAVGEAASNAAAAPVAYVYVQTAKGVDVFTATSAGKLTLVKGSPFATTGQMEGVNGKYLISVGNTNLRVYPIGSTGGLGKQVSVINTQNYGGSECGTTSNFVPNGAVLDHTGKYFYVQLYGALDAEDRLLCAAWQSYRLESNGQLDFLGDIVYNGLDPQNNDADNCSVPTIGSNNKFAYGEFTVPGPEVGFATAFSTFAIQPNGLLQVSQSFSKIDPVDTPNSPGGNGPLQFYPTGSLAADPSGHMAALMYSQDMWTNILKTSGGSTLYQLASYSVNPTTGAISSSNKYTNMPSPKVCCQMRMSPSGKLLAMFGNGVQFMHFNGAAPITAGSVVIPSVSVNAAGWDSSNHLYALSYSSEKLYIFNATPTGVNQAAGSPYSLPAPYGITGIVVVPKL